MLSRVADSLYWMSRYLERAEHTARLIDVNVHQMLERSSQDGPNRWVWLLDSLHVPHTVDEKNEAYDVIHALTFDTANNASIMASIAAARENARQVRELISSEMWEQLNRLFLQVKRTSIEEVWFTEPHVFLNSVKEGIHLFRGITDATMNHSEGWHFIRAGCFIERATATAALLDVQILALMEAEEYTASDSLDFLGWVGLLKSCAAFEAYCKVYTATMSRRNIAEFLLLSPESPRSVRFAVTMMQGALQNIARSTNTRHTGRAERLAGRLRATLDYDQIEEIMSGNLHAYLENIQYQCAQIHGALIQAYIAYPIDVAISLRGASQA
jgi:uncharacterized alpha-E superfamily protein